MPSNSFYTTTAPHGPTTDKGNLNMSLLREGLILTVVKQDELSARLLDEVQSKFTTFTDLSFKIIQNKTKLKRIISGVEKHYEGELGWSHINPIHGTWMQEVLTKLIIRVINNSKRRTKPHSRPTSPVRSRTPAATPTPTPATTPVSISALRSDSEAVQSHAMHLPPTMSTQPLNLPSLFHQMKVTVTIVDTEP
jgi:hypothetical protein